MRSLAVGVGTLAALMSCALAVLAESSPIRVGAATISFDPTRFRAAAQPDGAHFSPQGAAAEDLSPVEVRVHSGVETESCATLSRHAFGADLYDATMMQTSAMTIGGLAAERFAAHTRCRNATPEGQVACVKAGGSAYLFSILQTGCRSSKPFSHADPLAEITAGVTFPR